MREEARRELERQRAADAAKDAPPQLTENEQAWLHDVRAAAREFLTAAREERLKPPHRELDPPRKRSWGNARRNPRYFYVASVPVALSWDGDPYTGTNDIAIFEDGSLMAAERLPHYGRGPSPAIADYRLHGPLGGRSDAGKVDREAIRAAFAKTLAQEIGRR